MKVVIFGASGIVAQHMRLCIPPEVTPVWYRHTSDPITNGFDLRRMDEIGALLDSLQPDVVVNLAGESNVDKVELSDTESTLMDTNTRARALANYELNVLVPEILARECTRLGARYIHISSQAVFDGQHPPYTADTPFDKLSSVNEYGNQKIRAERAVSRFPVTEIIRLSFVIGIRPLPRVGRKNPLEGMLDGSQTRQVADRWFSPLAAKDAAEGIWRTVMYDYPLPRVRHFGIPESWSRYDIANHVESGAFVPVTHDSFPGLAPRPVDTTYANSWFTRSVTKTIDECRDELYDLLWDRATEISLFLGLRMYDVYRRLCSGFGELHNAVTEDFNSFGAGRDDTMLLAWYRSTCAYIWELSSYHEHTGFNYTGMCKGITDRLLSVAPKPRNFRVLCLGDGIGDLTLTLRRAGLDATYHDLHGSRTSAYAMFRYWRQTGEVMPYHMTANWEPPALVPTNPVACRRYDAVVSLDFLEHVTDVERWVRAIYELLLPGGLFCAQNAFACGSGAEGPMPMHLARNDRWEKDWDPTLSEIGFEQLGPQWYFRS